MYLYSPVLGSWTIATWAKGSYKEYLSTILVPFGRAFATVGSSCSGAFFFKLNFGSLNPFLLVLVVFWSSLVFFDCVFVFLVGYSFFMVCLSCLKLWFGIAGQYLGFISSLIKYYVLLYVNVDVYYTHTASN
jgi:hypothetical protein